MATVVFDAQLNFKNVSALINEMESKVKTDNNSHPGNVLYFSSIGGYTYVAELLLDYLNMNKSEWLVVAFGELHSCATIVFAKYEGAKRLTSEANILFHLMQIGIDTREDVENGGNLRRAKANLAKSNKDYFALLNRLRLPGKYIKKIKKGKDVQLYYEEIIKLNWNQK